MTTSKPPESVRIGHLVYTLTEDRSVLLERCLSELSTLMGHTDHAAASIVIDAQMAACQKRDTVLHEVLHAIIETTGLSDEWGKEKEEQAVRRITPLLLTVLRDNPDLVAYLLKAT